ncbi:MAG: hypothetical protein WCK89_10060, partial [bacterium]
PAPLKNLFSGSNSESPAKTQSRRQYSESLKRAQPFLLEKTRGKQAGKTSATTRPAAAGANSVTE